MMSPYRLRASLLVLVLSSGFFHVIGYAHETEVKAPEKMISVHMGVVPRMDEHASYSPPPSVMGKQLGSVHTLNVPPLGYELDGDVKVFTLIAQPIEHVFTDGMPVDPDMIPMMKRTAGMEHAGGTDQAGGMKHTAGMKHADEMKHTGEMEHDGGMTHAGGMKHDGGMKHAGEMKHADEMKHAGGTESGGMEYAADTASSHAAHMMGVSQTGIVWGYNGSMPGPTIEAFEGDTIRVIFKNELPEPSSIHWHGLEVPNGQDGAGGTTEMPTPPGGTHVYEFTLYQTGTFMYHTGYNVMKQEALGLGGIVVVHPKFRQRELDKDVAILLQEWTFEPGNPNPNVVSMDFNWFTFNGKSAPNIEVIHVQQGDRVRLRFANLSMQSHPIHVHGYTWKVVGTEGGPIPESAQWPGATVNVPPGTTRDVEFVAWNPGVWRLHCHRLHHVMNAMADSPMEIMPHGGMFTLIRVVPKNRDAEWQHPVQVRHQP